MTLWRKTLFDNLERMIKATHGISYKCRISSRKEFRRESIRKSILQSGEEISISVIPCLEMIEGFIPELLKWYRQCESENPLPLQNYIDSYYDKNIPEFLATEIKLFSYHLEDQIKNFPYIYQQVMVHQLKEFTVKDTISLNKELSDYGFKD